MLVFLGPQISMCRRAGGVSPPWSCGPTTKMTLSRAAAMGYKRVGQDRHGEPLMATAKPPDVRKRSPLRRLLRSLIVFSAVPYLGILVLLAVLQRSLIYGPTNDDTLNLRPAQISGARVEPIQL